MKHCDCRFVCVDTNNWALECMAERARNVCLRDAVRVARREVGGSERYLRRQALCFHAHALPAFEVGGDGWVSEWVRQREWTAGAMHTPPHAHSTTRRGGEGVSAETRRSGMHSQRLTRVAVALQCIAKSSLRTVGPATWARQWRCQWKDGGRERGLSAATLHGTPRCHRHAHTQSSSGGGSIAA